ncbi:hypothetical protein [Saccharomonospora sp.]|uniref:hypothetical protein n=1 Tax=Saccharomonospora sp. TaxID=33913 RepID=UPI0026194ADF|nr:hypothetical protein [Saccharomonospora sp.]
MGNNVYHYRRVLRPPKAMKVLLWVLFAESFVVAGIMWLLATGSMWVPAVVTVLILGFSSAMLTSRGVITVDDTTLRLAMTPVFRKTIPLADVASVEPGTVDPWADFSGWGYKSRGKDLVGFLFDSGPAARVTTRAGRTYVIATPDADRLVEVLRQQASLRV